LAILFLTLSCEQDVPIFEEEQTTGPNFEVTKLKGDQLDRLPYLKEAFEQAKEQLNPTTTFQKSFYDSINQMWIDDSQVNHLTSGDYESYTYAVYKNDSLNNKIYNLVFTKRQDSSFTTALWTMFYDDSVENVLDFDNYVNFEIQDINTLYQKNNSLPVCNGVINCDCLLMRSIKDPDNPEIIVGYKYYPSDPCPETIEAGDSMNAGDTPDDSPPGDDGNDDDNNDHSGDNTPGGNNQNNTDTSNDGDHSNPAGSSDGSTPTDNAVDPCDGILLDDGSCGDAAAIETRLRNIPETVHISTQNFFNSLPVDLRLFINSHKENELRQEIDQFLIDNYHLPTAIEFAKKAIKALNEDEEATINFEEGIINKLKNRDGHSKILEGIKNQNGPITSIINTTFNSNHPSNKLIFSSVPDQPNNQSKIAWTNPFPNGTYEIVYNEYFLDNATDLAFVMVTIHEMIHTNLSYLNNKDVLPYPSMQPSIEHHPYASLIQEFLTYVANQQQGNANDHQFMASEYLELLSQATYDWAITPILDGGGGYDANDLNLKPHLDKLAWIGLNQSDFNVSPGLSPGGEALTPAWQDLVNSDIVQAQQILDVIRSEIEPNSSFNNQNLTLGNNVQ